MTLTSADTLDSLGVQVRPLGSAEVSTTGADPVASFMITGGTVEITAIAPDANAPFVATVTNATFAEVDGEFVPVANGCTAQVARDAAGRVALFALLGVRIIGLARLTR